jgi:hypothetical protein
MGARILWSGYAQIIRLLIDRPRSWVDVCAATNLYRRESAHKILYGFADAGLAHICGWEMDEDARSRRPLFAWGAGANVAFPPRPGSVRLKELDGLRHRRRKVPPPSLLLMIVAIRTLMNDEPQHGKGLAEKTGACNTTALLMLRAMKDQGLIYIDHFQDRGVSGAGYPLYAWGPGEPDAVKPRRIPKRALSTKNNRNRAARTATSKLLHIIAGTNALGTRYLERSAEIVGALS